MSSMRLKEQDDLIKLVQTMVEEFGQGQHSIDIAFGRVQELLAEHMRDEGDGKITSLQKLLPKMGRVFLRLDLRRALADYDRRVHLTRRRHVAPSFADVRHIINLATVRALGPVCQLVTLDADDTIYADGAVMDPSSPMVPVLTRLLISGLQVGVVTAASYPGDPSKFEARLAGLLSSLAYAIDCGAPTTLVDNFYVMGGQCNYLLRTVVTMNEDDGSPRVHLVEVPPEMWKGHRGVRWDHEGVRRLLDTAERSLRATASELELDVLLIRKERAVGIVSRNTSSPPLTYEVLEECALAIQQAIRDAGLDHIPHCAFNGGKDVFVDVGHKALGIRALQGLTGVLPEHTVHCGDRFTATGNDRAARDVANTLWVASPSETEFLLTLLTSHMREAGRALRPSVRPTVDLRAPDVAGSTLSASSASSPFSPQGHAVVSTPSPSPTLGPSSQAALTMPVAHEGDIAESLHLATQGTWSGTGMCGVVGPGVGSPKYGAPHLHSEGVVGPGVGPPGGGGDPGLGRGSHADKETVGRIAESVRSHWAASGGAVVGEVIHPTAFRVG